MFSDFVSVWELSVCDVCAYLHLYILLVLFFGSFFFFFFSLLCPVPVCLFLLYFFLCACLFSTGREKGKWIWAGRRGGSGRSWVRGNHDQNTVWKKKKQELLSMKKKDLFILIIYVWVFACLYVCVHRVNDWPLRRPEGSTGSPGAGIIAGCESPSRCWKPNPGPPQKQQVCVARDTSLQLLNSIWEGTWDERLL